MSRDAPGRALWLKGELSTSKTISTVTSGAGLSPLPPHAALPTAAGCQTLLWGRGVCTPFLWGLSGVLWAPLKADGRGAMCVCLGSGTPSSRMCLCLVLSCWVLCPWILQGGGTDWAVGQAGHVLCGLVVSNGVNVTCLLSPTWSQSVCRLCSSLSLLLQSWSPAPLCCPCSCPALRAAVALHRAGDGTEGVAVESLALSSHLWSPPLPAAAWALPHSLNIARVPG